MRPIALAMLVALSACGAKGPLKWPEGKPAPTPVGAAGPQTGEQMLEPPPQAAPDRVDDPIRRSRERGDDPFDIPPPGR